MPPPSAPLLPSFRIQGFRAFRDLEIPRLGRVNLIVGKNNVGKTTVLEALKVYAAGSEAPWEIRELLERRQEIRRGSPREKTSAQIDIERIFFQPISPGRHASIHLGPSDKEKQLHINPIVLKKPTEEPSSTQVRPEGKAQESEEVWRVSVGGTAVQHFFPLTIGSIPSSEATAMRYWESRHETTNVLTCGYLPARGIDRISIGALWDSIVLTANEQSTLQALRIIAPDIERVSLVEDPRQQGVRYALIVRKTRSTPEPLHSMGDGMNRIFELALSLVSARDGLFLIDEVENGVHYSAQEQLWRFIFEAASQLNVQVFATTHSWDCISAFQKAASSHPEDGMLISLAQTDGDIKATVFNEGDLEIITRESIEVR